MANKKYPKEKPISLFEQKISLKMAYKGCSCEIKGNVLLWIGDVQPTPISRTYTVVVKFRMWESPQIWIIGDSLQNLDSPDFPHKYDIDANKKMVRICLYRYREFNTYKFLSKTIIPWTIEWLYFYEIWLATGEWCGGGEHPNTGDIKEPPKEKQ